MPYRRRTHCNGKSRVCNLYSLSLKTFVSDREHGGGQIVLDVVAEGTEKMTAYLRREKTISNHSSKGRHSAKTHIFIHAPALAAQGIPVSQPLRRDGWVICDFLLRRRRSRVPCLEQSRCHVAQFGACPEAAKDIVNVEIGRIMIRLSIDKEHRQLR